jgi:hypothetical protein
MNTKALGSETVFLRQNDRILLCFAGFRCFEILGYGWLFIGKILAFDLDPIFSGKKKDHKVV